MPAPQPSTLQSPLLARFATLPSPILPPHCRVAPEVLLGGQGCTLAVDIYSFGEWKEGAVA